MDGLFYAFFYHQHKGSIHKGTKNIYIFILFSIVYPSISVVQIITALGYVLAYWYIRRIGVLGARTFQYGYLNKGLHCFGVDHISCRKAKAGGNYGGK